MPQPQTPTTCRDEQRQHIIETATRAFHHEGIKSVTMDDIAHRLGMSKRTLYQLFVDKEALLLACIQWHGQNEHDCYEQMAAEADNVLDMVLSVFAHKLNHLDEVKGEFFAEIAKYPSVVRHIEQCQRQEEASAVDFLERGVEQGFFRPEVNFAIVVRYITGGMHTIVRAGLLDDFTQREIFFNTAMNIVRGCATLKGIEQIDRFTSKYAGLLR